MEKDRATLIRFSRQFACMIDAGLPLVQCLEICIEHEADADFAKALGSVKRDVVEEGNSFSDSLRKHPKYFDQYYVWMVSAGEAGGILDTILNRLASYLEHESDMDERITHAFGDSLPNILALAENIEVARFARTLGSQLASGIPVLDALEITAEVVRDKAIRAAIKNARSAVASGKSLAPALAEFQALPPMVVQMIGVGEQTDCLDAMLTKIAEFYEDEAVRMFSTLERRRS